MKKIKAFSLAEVLVCLSVIALMYMVITPVMAKFSPKDKKVLLRKSYNTIEKDIFKMINDDYAYPDTALGFANTTATTQSNGKDKFCYYFIDTLNTVESDYSTCKAKTTDGVHWEISNIKFKNSDDSPYEDYSTKISVDVNGSKSPNCSYSGSCKEPDQFEVQVRYDGKIKLTDDYVINLLKNPTKNN